MVVIATKSGRLGNRLILFAHFIAWAIEHQQKLANITMDEYAEFFTNLEPDLFCRYPSRTSLLPARGKARRVIYWVWLRARPSRRIELPTSTSSLAPANKIRLSIRRLHVRTYNWRQVLLGRLWRLLKSFGWANYVKLQKNQQQSLDSTFANEIRRYPMVFIEGWEFRNNNHVMAHREAIREFLQPVPTVRRSVEAVIAQARRNADVLVGVHIRRGDYKEFESGRFYYGDETYRDLMRNIQSELSGQRVSFLLCSDEVLKLETFSEFSVQLGPGRPVDDMHALAECDFLTGPPSTFTLWAAFVGSPRHKVMTTAHESFSMEDFKRIGKGPGEKSF